MDVSNIVTLTSSVDDEIKEEYEHLLIMTTVEPNVYISLKERVEVVGLFGMCKEIDKIAFYVDDYGGFLAKPKICNRNHQISKSHCTVGIYK